MNIPCSVIISQAVIPNTPHYEIYQYTALQEIMHQVFIITYIYWIFILLYVVLYSPCSAGCVIHFFVQGKNTADSTGIEPGAPVSQGQEPIPLNSCAFPV